MTWPLFFCDPCRTLQWISGWVCSCRLWLLYGRSLLVHCMITYTNNIQSMYDAPLQLILVFVQVDSYTQEHTPLSFESYWIKIKSHITDNTLFHSDIVQQHFKHDSFAQIPRKAIFNHGNKQQEEDCQEQDDNSSLWWPPMPSFSSHLSQDFMLFSHVSEWKRSMF